MRCEKQHGTLQCVIVWDIH